MDSPVWISVLATGGVLGAYLTLAHLSSRRLLPDRLDQEAYARARRRFLWASIAVAGLQPLRALLSSELHSLTGTGPTAGSLIDRLNDASDGGPILLFWLIVMPGSALASVSGFSRSGLVTLLRPMHSERSSRRSAGLARRARMSRRSWLIASFGVLGNVLFLAWAATGLERGSGGVDPMSADALLSGATFALELALLLILQSAFNDPELSEFLAEPLPPGGSPSLEERYTKARVIREGASFEILTGCSVAGWLWIAVHVLGEPTRTLQTWFLVGLVLACLAYSTHVVCRGGALEAGNRRTFRELSRSTQRPG